MNGVAMARHGLILWENEATGSRNVSRYLPDLRDTMFDQHKSKQIQQSQKSSLPIDFRVKF